MTTRNITRSASAETSEVHPTSPSHSFVPPSLQPTPPTPFRFLCGAEQFVCARTLCFRRLGVHIHYSLWKVHVSPLLFIRFFFFYCVCPHACRFPFLSIFVGSYRLYFVLQSVFVEMISLPFVRFVANVVLFRWSSSLPPILCHFPHNTFTSILPKQMKRSAHISVARTYLDVRAANTG